MAPGKLLERNVKPRRAVEDEESVDALSGKEDGASFASDEDAGEDGGSADESQDGEVGQEISNVSFGALKQAQDALSKKRKRGSDTTADQEEKLEALRARLRDIKAQKNANKTTTQDTGRKRKESKPGFAKVTAEDDEGSDSDSAPSEEGAAQKSRSSKHAPASQSSRRAVTRKRNVVDVPKRVTRDPRFDAIHQHSAHPGTSHKAYGFLRDYQKSEIAELKSAMKKAKSEDDRETLKRKLISMENRIKSEESKEREQEVLRQHRREEKDRVEQGKKPYFLKRKEVKERALVEKFKGMKGKEREKLIEKRKRKEGQREKKRMPGARRVAG